MTDLCDLLESSMALAGVKSFKLDTGDSLTKREDLYATYHYALCLEHTADGRYRMTLQSPTRINPAFGYYGLVQSLDLTFSNGVDSFINYPNVLDAVQYLKQISIDEPKGEPDYSGIYEWLNHAHTELGLDRYDLEDVDEEGLTSTVWIGRLSGKTLALCLDICDTDAYRPIQGRIIYPHDTPENGCHAWIDLLERYDVQTSSQVLDETVSGSAYIRLLSYCNKYHTALSTKGSPKRHTQLDRPA